MSEPSYVGMLGEKTAAQIAALPVEYLRAGNLVVDHDSGLLNYHDGTAWVPIPIGP